MRPPSALVELELVELLLPYCRFCSEVVTKELIAAAAVVDASAPALCLVVAAVDLLAARLVSNLLNAALKLVSTLVDGVDTAGDPCRLPSNSLFADCSTKVDRADTVDATELAVICVGVLVVTLADCWVGALVAALADCWVGALVAALADSRVGALVLAAWVEVETEVAALYSAAKPADCDDEETELIDITCPKRWLA
jgi:hypothetical protein